MRQVRWSMAASVFLLLCTLFTIQACTSGIPSSSSGHDNALQLGTHLRSLAEEHRRIAAAVKAECVNDLPEDDASCTRLGEVGIAAGKLINTAHTSFDIHRLNTDNTITAAGVDGLVKAAEVSMIALETLVTSAGITWEN